MGLRCLIGHDFGDLQTEQDRRERGDEVVVTIREYRECARCGETRLVSENKEVRSVVTEASPEEVDADDETAASPVEDVGADDDDGVILEDEPEAAPERKRGEWPGDDRADPAETGDGDPDPWPDVDGEDEGYAAEVGDSGPAEGVEFSGGLTPEASPAEPDTAGGGADGDEVVEASSEGGGFRRASPSPSPTGQQRAMSADTEFFCPECEFVTPTADSSLRPGDICPECRLGYLTERER